MCQFIINNRKCKNSVFKKGYCHSHYYKMRGDKIKNVSFNLKNNQTKKITKYIFDLKKMDDGRWYYENGENINSKTHDYNYSRYGAEPKPKKPKKANKQKKSKQKLRRSPRLAKKN